MKHPRKVIKNLNKQSNVFYKEAKSNSKNENTQKILFSSIVTCEKAYDLYFSFDEKSVEAQFRLEFNLTILYLLTNQNNKCFYYLDKIRRSDLSKTLDERKNREIGLLHLKLASNYIKSQNNDRENFDKILTLYKHAADYFEKFILNETSENDEDNRDFSIYCQILITIAKFTNLKLLDEGFIDKVISVCKNLQDDCIRAKIYSDLSTLIIRLAKDKGNFHKAESLLKKALGLLDSEKFILQGVIFHNLGALYNRYNEYHKAVQHINRALDLLKEKNGSYIAKEGIASNMLLSDLYYNLGYAYAKLHRIDESAKAFNSSMNSLENSISNKNKWENLSALGTLSIIKNDDETALTYYKKALDMHHSIEVKDESYLNVQKILLNKIDSTKRRIQLNNSLKIIKNDLMHTYESIDFSNENDDDDDISDEEKNSSTTKNKGILKDNENDSGKKIFMKLKNREERKKSNSNIENAALNSTRNSIPTVLDENTNKLCEMELSTKQASGEFLNPIQTDKNKNNVAESSEMTASQKNLNKEYIEKINEFEEVMEKKTEAPGVNSKKTQKIDPDVIERLDGAPIVMTTNQPAKKKTSKICTVM